MRQKVRVLVAGMLICLGWTAQGHAQIKAPCGDVVLTDEAVEGFLDIAEDWANLQSDDAKAANIGSVVLLEDIGAASRGDNEYELEKLFSDSELVASDVEMYALKNAIVCAHIADYLDKEIMGYDDKIAESEGLQQRVNEFSRKLAERSRKYLQTSHHNISIVRKYEQEVMDFRKHVAYLSIFINYARNGVPPFDGKRVEDAIRNIQNDGSGGGN